ncbi:hypothetical protein CEXT_24931 [Caerostris extrusa]|uniref:Uncharacterized protein n=1 Tax=Caerostris extrusa TaxID=172846 RepID=A0AAV4PE70_CAEEX|nr:hypothetical protein CEXT_24931 [Caerostris extrusa]
MLFPPNVMCTGAHSIRTFETNSMVVIEHSCEDLLEFGTSRAGGLESRFGSGFFPFFFSPFGAAWQALPQTTSGQLSFLGGAAYKKYRTEDKGIV